MRRTKKHKVRFFKQDTSQISPLSMTVKIIQVWELLCRIEMLSKGQFSTPFMYTYQASDKEFGGTFKSQVHKNAKRHDSTYLRVQVCGLH